MEAGRKRLICICYLDEQQNPVTSLWLKMKKTLGKINFFKNESSIITEIENINEISIIATRVYIILLTCCVYTFTF